MDSTLAERHDGGNRRSPFFARTYGGFTRHQADYLRLQSGPIVNKTIIDPMAGQAVELSMLPFQGGNVFLADVNPAPLLMAILRHPAVVSRREQLVRRARRVLSRLPERSGSLEYVDGWLAAGVMEDLALYAKETGVSRLVKSAADEASFWRADPDRLFWAALPLLCARQITCYRTSDNVTWIKAGALSRVHGIRDALEAAVNEWSAFAAKYVDSTTTLLGTLSLIRADAAVALPQMPCADLVVTSPPYANRLDYASLWSPELAVFSQLSDNRWGFSRKVQIGTTIVRGFVPNQEELCALPARTRETLEMIRIGKAKASDTYYYPFFTNYALSLARVAGLMADRVKRGGRLIIFVRDTVRKDVLFETGGLVDEVLSGQGLARVDRQRHVIRQHIGSLRKLSVQGIYGTAQQEWWLTFQRT